MCVCVCVCVSPSLWYITNMINICRSFLNFQNTFTNKMNHGIVLILSYGLSNFLCSMYICYEHSMYVSHIRIWLWYTNNSFQWPKSKSMPQWQEPNNRLPWSNLKIPTAWSELNLSVPWSDFNFNCLPLRQTTQQTAYIVQIQLPTDSFSKSSNSLDHRFRAWRHSHSSTFPIWGLSWQLWLSYPLRASVNCTQCLCTGTKSRIVQSSNKLNDKI